MARPSEGATTAVTVILYEDGGIVSVESTTTAADGTYMFGTVGSGDYDLEFTATDYVTEWFDNAASAAAGSVTVESGQADDRVHGCRRRGPGSGISDGNRG